MKSKKVTMLAAALVVAVVAAAGIGYAAVSNYTATTSNTNNTLDSTYITVNQGGTGTYDSNTFFKGLYFDTVNVSDGEFNYYPVCDYTISADDVPAAKTDMTDRHTGYAKVSEDLQLTVVKANSKVESLSLTIEATNFTPVTGLSYTMVIFDNATTPNYVAKTITTGNTWTFNDTLSIDAGLNASAVYTVALYISATSGTPCTTAPTHAGFQQGGTTSSFNFTFSAAASA